MDLNRRLYSAGIFGAGLTSVKGCGSAKIRQMGGSAKIRQMGCQKVGNSSSETEADNADFSIAPGQGFQGRGRGDKIVAGFRSAAFDAS